MRFLQGSAGTRAAGGSSVPAKLRIVNANHGNRTAHHAHLFVLFLLCLLAASTPLRADSTHELPGGSARALSWNASNEVLAASMALKGVAFLLMEKGSVVRIEPHADWPTLYALPLDKGEFLLADRFGSLRLVYPQALPGGGFHYLERTSWKCEGLPTHLATSGDGLLVASGGAGLLLYDWKARDAEPVLKGRFPYVDYTKEIAFDSKGIAYLADNFETGLQVVDGRDLLKPKLLAMRSGGFADTVAVHGALLAVGNRQRGTQFYDIANPLEPRLLGAVMPGKGIAGKPGIPKAVDFDARGRLLICEGTAGARLVEPVVTDGVLAVRDLKKIPVESALDAVFLPGGILATATDKGTVVLCPID